MGGRITAEVLVAGLPRKQTPAQTEGSHTIQSGEAPKGASSRYLVRWGKVRPEYLRWGHPDGRKPPAPAGVGPQAVRPEAPFDIEVWEPLQPAREVPVERRASSLLAARASSFVRRQD